MNQEGLSVKKLTEEQSWLQTGALLVLAFVAFSFGVAHARAILVPFTLALFLNYLVAPIVDIQMIRFKFSRFIAVTLALLLVVLVMVLMSFLLMTVVQNVTAVSSDEQFYRRLEQRLEGPLTWAFNVMDSWGDQEGDAQQRLVPRLIPPGEFLERSNHPADDLVPIPDEPFPSDLEQPDLVPTDGDEEDMVEVADTEIAASSERALPLEPEEDAPGEPSGDAPDELVELPPDWDSDVPVDEEAQERLRISRTRQFLQSIQRQIREEAPVWAREAGGTVLNMISSTVLTAIFVGFMLAGRDPYKVSKGIYVEIDRNVRRYIATKFFISAVTGLLVWFFLAMIGLRFASMFGLIAFGLNFIPSIGSIIATLLPIPIALVQFESPLTITLAIVLPGAVQMILGNVIEPKIMGDGLQLHPVTILLALAFFGMLWGPVGMLLAAPITASIRIVLMRFTTTEPIGKLMAGILPEEEDASDGSGI